MENLVSLLTYLEILGIYKKITIKDYKPVLRLTNLKKVQLYTVFRRQSFAFEIPKKLTMERQQVPSRDLLVERQVKPIRRRMGRIQSTKIHDDGRHVEVTL